MNDVETKRFEEACSKYEAGSRLEALQELHELIAMVPDVEERATLLQVEILWLIDLAEISQARARLTQLRRLVGNLGNSPPDTDSDDPRVSLFVRTEFTEAKLLLFEDKGAEGNRILDNLVSSYPKQLSQYPDLLGYIQLVRGYYLADHAKWAEAVSALEEAIVPDDQKSLFSYYLGHCHNLLGHYDLARQELEESLRLGLTAKWECRAHYMLGASYYRLSDLQAAKREFQLCVETADPEYLGTTQIWEWLEETCRRLGLSAEAQKYRKMRAIPSGSRSN
jgi:tetratricopeptide (TPR) repeat protein